MARRKWHRYREMLDQFDMNYGDDESKLEGWQRLCDDCGVKIGPSIKQCKRILKSANINILDLIYAKQAGVLPQRHNSRGALMNYTRNGMIFPKNLAKENGFLTALLVEVF